MSLNLPDSAQRLVDILGMDAAMALIEAHGGTRIYIPMPKFIRPDHPLAVLLGTEGAQKLCRAKLGGVLDDNGGEGTLRVPLCPRIRQAAAVAQFGLGESAASLARRFKVTEKTIYEWVNKAGAQRCRRTLDMFEEISV
jgi:hypothetical protein